MKIEELLENFWNDYLEIAPSVEKINKILKSRGDIISNDHIALRTFNHPKVNVDKFKIFFEKFGYEHRGEYTFTQKKLSAVHLENILNPELPKIFISELNYKELSHCAVKIIDRELDQLENFSIDDLFKRKSVFNISFSEYSVLSLESEYAAWLCAIGYRPNHFTIDVNKLNSIKSLLDLNSILKENSILLNTSGGEVKGSAIELLEQSSTMADKVKVKFSDCVQEVPSCYYEFAFRHRLPSGEFYQGFVTTSADKIFESTNG